MGKGEKEVQPHPTGAQQGWKPGAFFQVPEPEGEHQFFLYTSPVTRDQFTFWAEMTFTQGTLPFSRRTESR